MAVEVGRTALARSRFDTLGMPEQDARQAYLDRLDGILATDFLEPFVASMTAYTLGPLRVLALGASARRSIRSADRIVRDGYCSLCVQYVVAGRASGDADGRPIVSEPGTVMILDYARPFTITDCHFRDVINIAVPRSMLPTMRRDDWHGAIPSDAAAGLLTGFMQALPSTLPVLPEISGPPLASAFVALLTSVLINADTPAPVKPVDHLIARAEHLIDTWIGSPELAPAWMAAKLNVSRSELYVALERFGGVARFITQRRLDGARAALENPHDHRQIKGIAFAFGFPSEAQFSRAFRASFGATASEIRRGVRSTSYAAAD